MNGQRLTAVEDRLLAKVETSQWSACWLWRGGTDRLGYGSVYADGRTRSAHRVAYELAFGSIPAGLVLDHLCRVPRCVNPLHLEPVTVRENLLRGVSPTILAHVTKRCIKEGHDLRLTAERGASRNGCAECRRQRERMPRDGRDGRPVGDPS